VSFTVIPGKEIKMATEVPLEKAKELALEMMRKGYH
jgi:hypothetical protein